MSAAPEHRGSPGPSAVIFDFDGVILESTDIKTDAFRTLFSTYPEHLEAILEHHQTHLGVSRFEKFAWIYRQLLGRELEDSESQRLGERFSQLVLERCLKAPLVPGALEVLRRLDGRTPAFVVSGTPHEELERIVRERGLAPYFTEIRGSPPSKPRAIRDILARYDLEPGETLLVGDGLSDYRAAQETGLRFVARITPDSPFGDQPVRRITDLRGLLPELEP